MSLLNFLEGGMVVAESDTNLKRPRTTRWWYGFYISTPSWRGVLRRTLLQKHIPEGCPSKASSSKGQPPGFSRTPPSHYSPRTRGPIAQVTVGEFPWQPFHHQAFFHPKCSFLQPSREGTKQDSRSPQGQSILGSTVDNRLRWTHCWLLSLKYLLA